MEPTTMFTASACKDSSWMVFTLPAFLGSHSSSDPLLLFSLLLASLLTTLLTWAVSPGGHAWRHNRTRLGRVPIPGPRGLPVLGSLLTLTRGLPHRALSSAARATGSTQLMAFSIGNTPAVVSSDPTIAKEILCHPSFADRPLKRSARELMFGRAMGFAPSGTYWRLLRRIGNSHLFAPRRIAAHEPARQEDCDVMVRAIAAEQSKSGFVILRGHLQRAALNNIMRSVFGKRYDVLEEENQSLKELKYLVREGFELLGAFNCSDHLPWVSLFYDPNRVARRCAALVPRVRDFVKGIIEEHRERRAAGKSGDVVDNSDFVDVLLSLDGDEKLTENDMIAVLWEMIFRGTDTTALLTEWAMAELVLHPDVQAKLRTELDSVEGPISDFDVATKLPYLQAVVKETLRVHPPGPLLSWARLSTSDVQLSNGMVVPAHTTAMVNMWSIARDPAHWAEPERFAPGRFVAAEGGADVDVRGGDLRLAPFGAGRRVCPGKNLGIATVGLWIARLVREFEWGPAEGKDVDLSELLKLSCEMKTPLAAVAKTRTDDVC